MASDNALNKSTEYISIDLLMLDPQNPRLPDDLLGSDQSMLLEHISTTTAIEDLMGAIAANDYFPGEPVVAYKRDNLYTVIEGNRRLSAVKLLNNPHLLERPSARILQICEEAKYKPTKIPVIISDTREEVLPYLGFRHITGVKQWEPIAKARYMKQLLDLTEPDQELRDRYRGVARMIGSRADSIRRNLDALAVYEVAEKNDFYQIKGLDEESFKFAVLSTALADPRISTFIGITSVKDEVTIYTQPILDKSGLATDSVEEITRWLFEKGEDSKARVPESRDIRLLSQVVGAPDALSAFRKGSSLEYAYRLTEGIDAEFMELLYEVQSSIQKAAGLVANVKYSEEAFQCAKDIAQNVRLIGDNFRNKKKEDDEFSF